MEFALGGRTIVYIALASVAAIYWLLPQGGKNFMKGLFTLCFFGALGVGGYMLLTEDSRRAESIAEAKAEKAAYVESLLPCEVGVDLACELRTENPTLYAKLTWDGKPVTYEKIAEYRKALGMD